MRADDKPRLPRVAAPDSDLSVVTALTGEAWRRGEALAEAGDLAAGLAWLERAHRLAPNDQNLRFALAWLRLRAGDAAGAAALFAPMAAQFGLREAWCGLIGALLAEGRQVEAAAAMATALSGTAADGVLVGLARKIAALDIAAQAGPPGWCGLAEDGCLLTDLAPGCLSCRLDGKVVAPRPVAPGQLRLPPRARRAAVLEVAAAGVPLRGSPIAVARIFRLEAFARREGAAVSGFAWHPAAPGRDPLLTLTDAAGVVLARRKARAPLETVRGDVPLARPRQLEFTAPARGLVHVLGPDGRDILGSPLPARMPKAPAGRAGVRAASPALAVDVVIPVYRGHADTMACLESVRATVPAQTRVIVVNDASPEPDLVAALAAMARAGAITLIAAAADGRNAGFPAAANAGLRLAAGRHAILLNSDTLVAPGWLEALRDAACSAPDIGTATPLSNDASILSYPDPAGGNPMPDRAETACLAALAAAVNRGRLVDLPTAHGFCMFIRRDCLDRTGFLETRLFAQGYGEENDFSERARRLGYRHVAVPAVFVAHRGGVSFGGARQHLLERNLALLESRHPGYIARVQAWIAADPLLPARRRLDAARFTRHHADAGRPAVLLVTHSAGGGTARMVAARAREIRAGGGRPVILRAEAGQCHVGDTAGCTPNLRFVLPGDYPALRRLLTGLGPVAADVHHLLGHHRSVLRLFADLAIPHDIWVHDYAWFCPRITFVNGDGRFCGEAEAAICRACVARDGSFLEERISAASLRRRSQADLRAARAVIVPAADVARRVARFAPGLAPRIGTWEPPFSAPLAIRPRPVSPPGALCRVAVVGGIGIDKGLDVLLACARDAALRALRLEFVLVGYSSDDAALLATGRIFVTGPFRQGEADALIRAQHADLGFLPSIWPETWCYALSDVWAAGLTPVVFDIGTPAERVRACGLGHVLPLGLPAPRINDMLLRLAAHGAAGAA